MLLLAFLYIQTIAIAFAWQTTASVTGKIISPDGEALPGVVVLEKGTSNGQVTDLDGNFSIRVSSQESILVFSLVGFTTQEVQIGNQSIINLTLRETESLLSEVVVVGYGEQKNST